jgi:hypothetical protein
MRRMQRRSKHTSVYDVRQQTAGQQFIDFDAEPEPAPKAPAPVLHVEESPPGYRFTNGYENTYGRIVNWVILNPQSTELATVKTKKGAKAIVERLNDVPPAMRSGPNVYAIQRGYENPYGRTVDWVIIDPYSTELATVTTKKGATTLIDLLNGVEEPPRRRST